MLSDGSLFITPKEWVTNSHHMIRLRTWELNYDQVRDAVTPYIIDGGYKLIVREEKDGTPIGYSALLVEKESDMDRIRQNQLVARLPKDGEPCVINGRYNQSVIGKIQKYSRTPGYCKHTIKTTAPLWVTYSMIKEIFGRYSSDKELYTLVIDGKICENEQYPLVRFSKNIVMRHGVETEVNVVYVEYSPKPGCEDDALVAQSMQYRTYVKNHQDSLEIASLIFKFWKIEKIGLDKPRLHSFEEGAIFGRPVSEKLPLENSKPELFIIPKKK